MGRVFGWTAVDRLVAGLGAVTGVFALTTVILASINLHLSTTPRYPVPVAYNPCPTQDSNDLRRIQNYDLRVDRAVENAAKAIPCQTPNGDEAFYETKIGSYSKGMQHNAMGEVEAGQFAQFVHAIETNNHNQMPRSSGAERRYVNPQAALAFDLLGGDSHSYYQPAAPVFNSTEQGGEYVELAWMAILRDISFADYSGNALALMASSELNALGSNFTGPTPVTEDVLFRGQQPGCLVGPYLAQFFYKPIQYGYHEFKMKIDPHAPTVDFMTNYGEFLNIQNGLNPSGNEQLMGPARYMINGRDLANWVHVDVIWQAYHMATLSLFTMGAPYNPTNPYLASLNQEGFATFGAADVVTKVSEVATHALHAVWNQKWRVHRRQRPEAFGGRVHVHKTMGAMYPIDPSALNSMANSIFFAQHSSYLLPQAYPEGSPMHPSYGAGHAMVAGACVTVLKAFFDGSWMIPDPVEPTLDGSALLPLAQNLTVHGELDKLANNIALGRNIAGVHWRTDGTESLTMGEQVAIDFLRDYKKTYNERFTGWSFVNFEGRRINI